MAKRGGWFRMYSEILSDAKIARLRDLEFRVWVCALAFCNQSPARLRRGGFLYHSPGFPVTAEDFARILHKPLSKITKALDGLSKVGGDSPLLACKKGVYQIPSWRKRQDLQAQGELAEEQDGEGNEDPEKCRAGDKSVTEPCQSGDSLVTETARSLARARVEDLDLDRDKGSSRPQPPAAGPAPQQCSWCGNPMDPADEAKPGAQRLMQVYHDAWRRRYGECPVIEPVDFKLAKGLLRRGQFEQVRAVVKHGLDSEDGFLLKTAHTFRVLASQFVGIQQAFKKGMPYGSRAQGSEAAGAGAAAGAELEGRADVERARGWRKRRLLEQTETKAAKAGLPVDPTGLVKPL
jgi:hypothetical protein